MDSAEIKEGIDKALKSLRKCDTQATAIQWMADAYRLMEACLPYLEPSPPSAAPSPIFTFKRPEIVIAHAMPTKLVRRERSETVVYPEMYLHPGLKPPPRAWTRADTLRLEAAAKARAKPLVQKKGK